MEALIGGAIALVLAMLGGAFGYGRLTGRVVMLERTATHHKVWLTDLNARVAAMQVSHAELNVGQRAISAKLDDIAERIGHGHRE